MADTIKFIQELALREYNDWGRGVKYVIEQDPRFSQKNAVRTKDYRTGKGFKMSRPEQYYHLMGFIDGLYWAYRKGYIPNFLEETEPTYEFDSPEEEEEWKKEEQRAEQRELEHIASLSTEMRDRYFYDLLQEIADKKETTRALNSLLLFFATGETDF